MVRQFLLCLSVVFLICCQVAAQAVEDTSKGNDSETRARLEALNENLLTVNSDIAILKWLKVSGYLQARYEVNDTSKDGTLPIANAPNRNANNIYVRRGRAKFTFQPLPTSRFVLQIDAARDALTFKDAYLDLTKSVQLHTFNLTAGQFNWPFGYEIEYSSSKRDFPERTLAERVLFRGERDRGINLTYLAPKNFKANVGVFQGRGIEGTQWFDLTKSKDVIARAKALLGMVDVGVSAYWGKQFVPGIPAIAARPSQTIWNDNNPQNGAIDPGEVTYTPAVAAVAAIPGFERDKIRYGADMQVYLDFLPIGGSAIRSEVYLSEDYNTKDSEDSAAQGLGWYLWLSQSLSTKFSIAARYDYWDVNRDADFEDDAIGTLSLAAHYFWDAHVRLTAAYDNPRLLKGKSFFSGHDNDVKDNTVTLQFQFMI